MRERAEVSIDVSISAGPGDLSLAQDPADHLSDLLARGAAAGEPQAAPRDGVPLEAPAQGEAAEP